MFARQHACQLGQTAAKFVKGCEKWYQVSAGCTNRLAIAASSNLTLVHICANLYPHRDHSAPARSGTLAVEAVCLDEILLSSQLKLRSFTSTNRLQSHRNSLMWVEKTISAFTAQKTLWCVLLMVKYWRFVWEDVYTTEHQNFVWHKTAVLSSVIFDKHAAYLHAPIRHVLAKHV